MGAPSLRRAFPVCTYIQIGSNHQPSKQVGTYGTLEYLITTRAVLDPNLSLSVSKRSNEQLLLEVRPSYGSRELDHHTWESHLENRACRGTIPPPPHPSYSTWNERCLWGCGFPFAPSSSEPEFEVCQPRVRISRPWRRRASTEQRSRHRMAWALSLSE